MLSLIAILREIQVRLTPNRRAPDIQQAILARFLTQVRREAREKAVDTKRAKPSARRRT
jgi:hypothetical protein